MTTRKRSKLTSDQDRYRALVEQAVEGFFRSTPDGRLVMANQALARILGYENPKQLMVERRDLEQGHYVISGERARFRRLLDAQGFVQGFEYQAFRRDGTIVWLRDHARVVRDPDGTAYYEGTVEDVTNQRRAQELLDLRARQQAAVAQLGQTAISGADVNGLLEGAALLITQTLDVEFSQVLELRPEGHLIFHTAVGWNPAVIGTIVPVGVRSHARLTLASEQPVIMDGWGPELRAQLPAYFKEHAVQSGVTVIIGAPQHPFGVLGAHTASVRKFTIDDINFLQAIASVLAAALVRRRGEEMREHLLARAISAQEEERTRLARELHDETGQTLSAILVGLRNLEDSETLAEARNIARRLRELTAQTVRDVGRLARGLRPSTLDHLGLLPALQRYAEEFGASHHLAVRIAGDREQRFPERVETTLYRIIQEALTNVARHAQAHSAEVMISREDGTVRATVRDDGRGFETATAIGAAPSSRTLGLMGMRERASLLGGSVVVTSRPGHGTNITIELPLLEPA